MIYAFWRVECFLFKQEESRRCANSPGRDQLDKGVDVPNTTWCPPTNQAKYEQAAAHPDAWTRLMRRTDAGGRCHLWLGAVNAGGYGVITVDKQMVFVHRLSWWLTNGPIPEGMTVDHLCHTRNCVNPAHLVLATNSANARRSRRALQTHCSKGHPFDDSNTRIWTDSRGYDHRYCIRCNRERSEAWNADHR